MNLYAIPSRRESTWRHLNGSAIVTRMGVDSIKSINKWISSENSKVRTKNHKATATPSVTDVCVVNDLERKSHHLVCIHSVDYRTLNTNEVGDIVVFSEPKYAPTITEKIQLATPEHYREGESLKAGIRDPFDGTLTKDGTKWTSSNMGFHVSSQFTFSTESEPWIYCASHYRTYPKFCRLRGYFDQRFGYSEPTRILDPNEFAMKLGVAFLLNFDKTNDIRLQGVELVLHELSRYENSLLEREHSIDTYVNVFHGPVNYENTSGQIEHKNQFCDPYAGPKAWFTKKSKFKKQSEYRFAISTRGTPVNSRHYISMNAELRKCVSEL